MAPTPFHQFIELVQVDQKINGLKENAQQLLQKNNEKKEFEHANQLALTAVKNKLHEVTKEVHEKELEMKTLDEQESQKKEQLERVANHKEYQAIKGEVDKLKKMQHELEEVLIEKWNRLETTKKEYDAALKAYEQQNKILETEILNNDTLLTDVNNQIAVLMQDRQTKEQGIPAEWLEKYAVMRSRVTDPVVPVIDGNCSACFYKVSTQDMQQLKHRKLLSCKDCFRLLYLPEAQEKLDEVA